MYCHKCHKQSPENFVNCAYCGAKLKPPKKKEPSKFQNKRKIKIDISLRTLLKFLIVVAAVLAVLAIITSIFTASKPEKVVKDFVHSVDTYDKELYFSLYDDNLIKYKKENRYFGDEETFNQMVIPVDDSDSFYKEKCGENFKLKYEVKSSTSLTDEELEVFNKMLESDFNYIVFPSQVDILSVEIIAKGDKGEYKSIYNDFWCMKIKGRWYMVDKTIYTQYENLQTTS